jgi:signal transduction histidine kinase
MIESNEFELKKKSFKFEAFLNQTLTQIMVQVNRKGLALIVEKDSCLPDYVNTDESRLEEILLNLLINAIKYTSKGRIKIRITIDKHQQDSICFQISDTGIGMSQDKLFVLFDSSDNDNIPVLMEKKASIGIFIILTNE